MEPQQPQALREAVVVGGHHAAFARRDRLDRVKAEDGRRTAPDRAAAVRRPEGMRGILDECKVVTLGDRTQRVEVDRLPGEVYGYDRARPAGYGVRHGVGIDVQRAGIDVHENRVSTDRQDHVARRGPGHRRGDHLVAEPDPCSEEREVEASGRGCHCDCVRRSDSFGEGAFELTNPWSARDPTGAQAGRDRGDLGVANARAGERQKFGAHGVPPPPSAGRLARTQRSVRSQGRAAGKLFC